MDFYEIVKSIGSGSFGQVYLARHKREDRLYVIKRIKIRDMNQKDKENTENEVRLLQKLRHTNIVAYKDSYLDREQYLNIVMTHCEGGDIYQKIRQVKQKNFPESTILDWMVQMSLALFYLHDQKILHRDLKTQNIFLKNGKVRLGDFGIAKVLDSTRDLANTCIGTPYYMSPELFKYKPYSYKSDVWAMGCCLYEMCNLRHAFDAQSIHGLALKIMKGTYPPIASSYSKSLRDIITRMLNINPKMRPTIWEIINKPLVKNRIIIYMLQTLSESSADVEDVYVDSLWEQADKLQITVIINHYQKLLAQGTSFVDIQKEIEKGGKGEQKILMQIQEQELLKQKLLKREQLEKKKLEEEILRLENRKNRIEDNVNKQRDSVPKQKKLVSVEREPKKIQDMRIKKDRSYSLEKDTPTQQQKKQIGRVNANATKQKKEGRKASVEDRTGSIEKYPSQQSQQSASTQSVSTSTPSQQLKKQMENESNYVDAKSKVMMQKQQKQTEQKQRWDTEFNQICQQNSEIRKKAQEQKFAQYRPSSGMNQMFQKDDQQNSFSIETSKNKISQSIEMDGDRQDSNIFQEESTRKISDSRLLIIPTKAVSKLKIQEDYAMYEDQSEEFEDEEDEREVDPIPEVENEDDYEEPLDNEETVEKKIEFVKTKIKEKTYRINELQQSLLQSKRFKEQQLKAFETGRLTDTQIQYGEDQNQMAIEQVLQDENEIDIEEREDFDDEDSGIKKPEQSSQQIRMNDRIKLLKHRCEAGLGLNIFQKGYELVKDKGSTLKGDDMRKLVADLLGEENVGYWHLLDQLLYVEELYNKFTTI